MPVQRYYACLCMQTFCSSVITRLRFHVWSYYLSHLLHVLLDIMSTRTFFTFILDSNITSGSSHLHCFKLLFHSFNRIFGYGWEQNAFFVICSLSLSLFSPNSVPLIFVPFKSTSSSNHDLQARYGWQGRQKRFIFALFIGVCDIQCGNSTLVDI